MNRPRTLRPAPATAAAAARPARSARPGLAGRRGAVAPAPVRHCACGRGSDAGLRGGAVARRGGERARRAGARCGVGRAFSGAAARCRARRPPARRQHCWLAAAAARWRGPVAAGAARALAPAPPTLRPPPPFSRRRVRGRRSRLCRHAGPPRARRHDVRRDRGRRRRRGLRARGAPLGRPDQTRPPPGGRPRRRAQYRAHAGGAAEAVQIGARLEFVFVLPKRRRRALRLHGARPRPRRVVRDQRHALSPGGGGRLRRVGGARVARRGHGPLVCRPRKQFSRRRARRPWRDRAALRRGPAVQFLSPQGLLRVGRGRRPGAQPRLQRLGDPPGRLRHLSSDPAQGEALRRGGGLPDARRARAAQLARAHRRARAQGGDRRRRRARGAVWGGGDAGLARRRR